MGFVSVEQELLQVCFSLHELSSSDEDEEEGRRLQAEQCLILCFLQGWGL
jgi:hypothetical protein